MRSLKGKQRTECIKKFLMAWEVAVKSYMGDSTSNPAGEY